MSLLMNFLSHWGAADLSSGSRMRQFDVGKSQCLLALLCLSFLCGVAAAEEDVVSESDFFREIPLVYSVSHLPQLPEDAAGAITVLDREFIRRSGVRDLADLFRLVPGFQVAWAAGGRPVVAYHGLTGQISQRMQVYVDGQSFYAPYLFGGVDWSAIQIPLEEIDRIEIQRGANSVSYGANAFMGVVHFITRSPAQSTGWRVETYQGSAGVSDLGVRWGASGDAWGTRLLAGRRADDGLLQRRDASQTEYMDWRGDWRQDSQSEWTAQLKAHRYLRQIGFQGNYGDPERDEAGNQAHLLLKFRRRVDSDQEWGLTYAHSRESGRDAFFIPLLDGDSLAIENARQATRDSVEFQHYKDISSLWRLSWGAQWQTTRLEAEQLFSTRQVQRDHSGRVYLNQEWRPDTQWTFNAGMVFEAGKQNSGQWAPRLSVNWKPAYDHVFKLGYSSAFRSPSLFEQRADWRVEHNGQVLIQRYLSRGGLQPETIRVSDLVYTGKTADGLAKWDIRLFREKIDQIITGELYQLESFGNSAPRTLAYDLRNNAQAQIDGLEVSLVLQPWPNGSLAFNHYWASAASNKPEIAASVPRQSGSAILAQDWGEGWLSSLAYSQVGKMQWLGEAAPVDVQHWLQFRHSKSWRWRESRLRFDVAVRKSEWSGSEFRPGQKLPDIFWLGLSVDH